MNGWLAGQKRMFSRFWDWINIPPELGKHREIKAARRKKLPNLIDYNDIKGVLHRTPTGLRKK